jgi:hypothetical protein
VDAGHNHKGLHIYLTTSDFCEETLARLTGAAAGLLTKLFMRHEFLVLFLLPGNRAGVTPYCDVAPSTPGRLG